MSNGKLTKIRKADPENGVEAKYQYEVDGMVYELEKHNEQYRYNRRNSFFSTVGYRDVWKAYMVTPEGLKYAATEDKRTWLIRELDERAERDASRIDRGIY